MSVRKGFSSEGDGIGGRRVVLRGGRSLCRRPLRRIGAWPDPTGRLRGSAAGSAGGEGGAMLLAVRDGRGLGEDLDVVWVADV
ncbi:hypothetical protein ACFV80_36155 [Streptomyces sp. NPDC059862]|uniref:hypothetical protein n=1 Tax=Streptomyces sp. NPDC059862 TaxID=3346975 RepID=UPI00365FB5FA